MTAFAQSSSTRWKASAPIEYLTVADLIGIHGELSAIYGGSGEIRDHGVLEQALFWPRSGDYQDVIAMAAALMERLGQVRPFVDGNARTAFAATDVFLRMNGYLIEGDAHTTFTYLAYLHKVRDFRFDRLDPWLREVARPIDGPGGFAGPIADHRPTADRAWSH